MENEEKRERTKFVIRRAGSRKRREKREGKRVKEWLSINELTY